MSLFQNEVANLALARLGSTLTIQNVDTDSSTQAKAVRVQFQTSLRTILEMYPWGFTSVIAPLELVEENPNASFAYSYRCPNDCLVIRRIGAEGSFQELEDRKEERNKYKEIYDATGTLIHTNIGLAYAEYTKDIDKDSLFPNHFGKALAAQLALDIAPSIITNNFAKVQNVLLVRAENEINKQISLDINRKPRPDYSPPRFVAVR